MRFWWQSVLSKPMHCRLHFLNIRPRRSHTWRPHITDEQNVTPDSNGYFGLLFSMMRKQNPSFSRWLEFTLMTKHKNIKWSMFWKYLRLDRSSLACCDELLGARWRLKNCHLIAGLLLRHCQIDLSRFWNSHNRRWPGLRNRRSCPVAHISAAESDRIIISLI